MQMVQRVLASVPPPSIASSTTRTSSLSMAVCEAGGAPPGPLCSRLGDDAVELLLGVDGVAAGEWGENHGAEEGGHESPHGFGSVVGSLAIALPGLCLLLGGALGSSRRTVCAGGRRRRGCGIGSHEHAESNVCDLWIRRLSSLALWGGCLALMCGIGLMSRLALLSCLPLGVLLLVGRMVDDGGKEGHLRRREHKKEPRTTLAWEHVEEWNLSRVVRPMAIVGCIVRSSLLGRAGSAWRSWTSSCGLGAWSCGIARIRGGLLGLPVVELARIIVWGDNFGGCAPAGGAFDGIRLSMPLVVAAMAIHGVSHLSSSKIDE